MQREDYYKILGVSRDADSAAIKKAFHKLALLHHPDRNPDDPSSIDRFRSINEAYQFLIIPDNRKHYEQGGFTFHYHESAVKPYLTAEIDRSHVKLNEEIELTYSFSSEGRFFRKPELKGCFITSGPIVSHRNSSKNGKEIRETLLTYTVCPLITGFIHFPPAQISYEQEKYASNSLDIQVDINRCYFKKDEIAGENPVRVMLHREQVTSNTIYRKTILHQRIVLLPRSDLAAWYHKVGRTLKFSMTVFGTALALLNDQNIILGALAGSLFAGINCQVMYKLMNIKPVFYYSWHYPLVNEYLDDGYVLGTGTGEGIINPRSWQFIKGLFV